MCVSCRRWNTTCPIEPPGIERQFRDLRGPAFLEVIIDPDAGVYPMVGPIMATGKRDSSQWVLAK